MWLLNLIFGAFVSEETLCRYAREYFNVYMDECIKYDILPFLTIYMSVSLGIIIFGMVDYLLPNGWEYVVDAVHLWLIGDSLVLVDIFEFVCWALWTLGIATTSPYYMLPWIFVKSVYLTQGFILFLFEEAGLIEAEGCASFHAVKKLVVNALIYVLLWTTLLQAAIDAESL